MADSITIPSPSAFLESYSPRSALLKESHAPKPTRKRNSTTAKPKPSAEKAGDPAVNGVEKKKQSKSRNGAHALRVGGDLHLFNDN